MFTSVRGGCDNHRSHDKNPRLEIGLGMWMTSCPEAMSWDSYWFWIKAVSWDLDLDKASWFFGPGRGHWVCGLWDAHSRWLSQWVESWRWMNSQYRKIASLFSRIENLNLKKVIKVSFLYQENRQCFEAISGFLCIFHIFISWSYFGEYVTSPTIGK